MVPNDEILGWIHQLSIHYYATLVVYRRYSDWKTPVKALIISFLHLVFLINIHYKYEQDKFLLFFYSQYLIINLVLLKSIIISIEVFEYGFTQMLTTDSSYHLRVMLKKYIDFFKPQLTTVQIHCTCTRNHYLHFLTYSKTRL